MHGISIQQFYAALRDAARFAPVNIEKPCMRLNAFRVLHQERGRDLESPTLGATVSDYWKPFFWSRKWDENKLNPNSIEFEYPILTAFEINNEASDSFFSKGGKHCYLIELSVIETYKEDCQRLRSYDCEGRTINEIYLDTQAILSGVLKWLGSLILADVTDLNIYEQRQDNGEATTPEEVINSDQLFTGIGLFSKPWLEARKLAREGEFSELLSLESELNALNPKIIFSRVEMPATKKYGTKTVIKFCTSNCDAVNYAYSTPYYGQVGHDYGCPTC